MPLLAMTVKEINKNDSIFPSPVFLVAEYMPSSCTKDHSYCVRGVFHAPESQYLSSCSTIAAILLSSTMFTYNNNVMAWLLSHEVRVK